MSGDWKLIVPLIITIFFINFVTPQCVRQDPCLCVDQDGWAHDLSAAKKLGPFTAVNSATNETVKFNPCENTKFPFPNCESTSLCFINSTSSINMGRVEETHWISPPHKNPQLILKHDPYMTHIDIICSSFETDKPTFSVFEKQGNNLFLKLEWNKLCPVDMTPKGLSTGSILLILFFTFTGIYFIGGSAALIFSRGAVGRETIPNYEFWADLPALVRDGITFTLNGCAVVSYESI